MCGEGEVSGDKFVVLDPRLLNITQRRLAAARAKRELFIPECYPEVAGRPCLKKGGATSCAVEGINSAFEIWSFDSLEAATDVPSKTVSSQRLEMFLHVVPCLETIQLARVATSLMLQTPASDILIPSHL